MSLNDVLISAHTAMTAVSPMSSTPTLSTEKKQKQGRFNTSTCLATGGIINCTKPQHKNMRSFGKIEKFNPTQTNIAVRGKRRAKFETPSNSNLCNWILNL